jgi:hypothetical protein
MFIAEGKTVTQIAEELFLSVKTVVLTEAAFSEDAVKK